MCVMRTKLSKKIRKAIRVTGGGKKEYKAAKKEYKENRRGVVVAKEDTRKTRRVPVFYEHPQLGYVVKLNKKGTPMTKEVRNDD